MTNQDGDTNWTENLLPQSNDTLLFEADSPISLINDSNPGNTYSLSFSTGEYTLSGHSITLPSEGAGIRQVSGSSLLQTPLVLLQTIAEKGHAYGDCDDHVVLLGAMLNSIGIPARAVAVKLGGNEWFDHVVIEYPSNGRTVTMDPCAKFGAAPRYLERLVTA